MSLQKNLLQWFAKSQRPLPWRKHYRPYDVWISEIMLQQTQVETALPYYERWMKRFPTLESLAKALEGEVLKSWEGLGYYSRARNLHHSAQEITRSHKGNFPKDFEAIRALKGIGRYTAGAIASIAFNEERPIVDGNVLRVLSRVFAISDPIDDLKNREKFWSLQESLIPKGEARNFNQAMMELGALVCTKQNPLCAQCPIRTDCKAYQTNRVSEFPVKSGKRKQVKVIAAALVLEKDGKVFIHQRPKGEIMGGLWEFPEWKLARDKKMSTRSIKSEIAKHASKEFGLKAAILKPIGLIKRNYTHHLETLHTFRVEVKSSLRDKRQWPSAWVTITDFKDHAFSSAHVKIGKLLSK